MKNRIRSVFFLLSAFAGLAFAGCASDDTGHAQSHQGTVMIDNH